ncbi:MAG: hypothetical protein RLZZ381_3342 [Cyanobacteriota bacterium]|jgi:hypothetical protein
MKTNTNKYWSEKFAANIKKSKPVDMYNLMTEVLEIEDNKVKILADFCVKMMIERDIKDFIRDPDSLKKILLEGSWTAYNSLSNLENIIEFAAREEVAEYFFEEYSQEIIAVINQIIVEEEKLKDLEYYFWQFIDRVNWREDRDVKTIAAKLNVSRYAANKEPLRIILRDLQRRLANALDPVSLGLNSDNFYHFTCHIIAMGQEEYLRIIREPKEAVRYLNTYDRNFPSIISELRC